MAEGNTASGDKPNDAKGSFMGIQLRGWAIVAVSLIVVCYVFGHFALKLYYEAKNAKRESQDAQSQLARTESEKQKIQEVNDSTSQYSDAVTREMTFHKTDGSGHQVVLQRGPGGNTVATFFTSDGCIAVARPGVSVPYLSHPQDTVEWLLGPSKKPPPSAPPAVVPPSTTPAPPAATSGARANAGREKPSQITAAYGKAKLVPAQVGCLSPHPWNFRSWWGPANGCWAPMYRQWNDGCTHYQMYNACTGQWDARIVWTYCNPQHHP